MRLYWIFRILTVACALGVVIITVLFYVGITDEKNLLLVSGILAVLAPIFGIFIAKPIEQEISGGLDKLLLTYDKDTLETLHKAKKEEQDIRDFIEHKSNEIFLIKLRSYLEQAIISKYENSEIAKLLVDLQEVESQLDAINIQYGNIQLPERFKKIVNDLNRRNRVDEISSFYRSVIEILPLPSGFISIISRLTEISISLASERLAPIKYKAPQKDNQ